MVTSIAINLFSIQLERRSHGSKLIRPTDPSYPEYIVVLRFNIYENLTKWERSQIRKEWLARGKEVMESETMVNKQTGVEVWFTTHSRTRNINADKALAALLQALKVMNEYCSV